MCWCPRISLYLERPESVNHSGCEQGQCLTFEENKKKKWFEGLLYCNLQCFFWCYNVLWMTISKRTFVETSTSGDHAMQEIFGPNSRP